MSFLAEEVEAQVDDIAKGADPTTRIRTRGSDGRTTGNGETAGVVSGGLEGSGKAFFHSSTWDFWVSNSTRAKRCFRERGIHDLVTMQHALRAAGSSWRWSTMRSSISCGREHDIVVRTRAVGQTLASRSESAPTTRIDIAHHRKNSTHVRNIR